MFQEGTFFPKIPQCPYLSCHHNYDIPTGESEQMIVIHHL
jgi:hypothetical protein